MEFVHRRDAEDAEPAAGARGHGDTGIVAAFEGHLELGACMCYALRGKEIGYVSTAHDQHGYRLRCQDRSV